jgi:hypothetical protein
MYGNFPEEKGKKEKTGGIVSSVKYRKNSISKYQYGLIFLSQYGKRKNFSGD